MKPPFDVPEPINQRAIKCPPKVWDRFIPYKIQERLTRYFALAFIATPNVVNGHIESVNCIERHRTRELLLLVLSYLLFSGVVLGSSQLPLAPEPRCPLATTWPKFPTSFIARKTISQHIRISRKNPDIYLLSFKFHGYWNWNVIALFISFLSSNAWFNSFASLPGFKSGTFVIDHLVKSVLWMYGAYFKASEPARWLCMFDFFSFFFH